jgi:hypothetical protein
MAIILSDQEIEELVQERKPLSEDYRTKMQLRAKTGHKERELDVKGVGGNEFRLIFRQGTINPIDFSIILAYRPPKSNQLFRLRRYNGKHWHTNLIEERKFFDFHVHQATTRYQEIGANEDSYAEPSDRFSDFNQALSCMLKECGFQLPSELQERLL